MSVDILQEKIRKVKNPVMVELNVLPGDIPGFLMEQEGSVSAASERFYRELLCAIKGVIPAVRISFAAFSLLGGDGFSVLTRTMKLAKEQGFYVLLDAPDLSSPKIAAAIAEGFLGADTLYPCDGLMIPGYLGSDVIKPFLPYCREGKKDLFVAVRTANKSAPELQDLLCGSRVVHAVAADHVNRYGADTAGKYGYTRVGILAGASSAESLRTLRSKYPKLFMVLDGLDYPNANGKNCSFAFDKYGHGAIVCAGESITGAWKEAESDGLDFAAHAVAAAERIKKNLTRYTTIL